ncbi:zinc ribbon domain-containing protein [Malonomonas rubra]|uniref:FmdB family zinc ribbon protein n=1 Tax=Malonomonas rubra TaxID=57040 RepID=UPI0026F15AD3|nr:zinc ribbon domain-containing protein [Malonomonas rubra]
MPLYEYQCESCGLQFEVRQKFSDDPVSKCHECGGPVNKLISQGGFALKGGGWYQQGYSQKPSCGSQKSEGCAGCPNAVNS